VRVTGNNVCCLLGDHLGVAVFLPSQMIVWVKKHMTSLKSRRCLTLLAVGLIVGSLLGGCTPGKQRILRLLETVPVPQGAELAYEKYVEDQGSEDACFFPRIYRLYGTDQSYEEVAAFYQARLDPAAWHRQSDPELIMLTGVDAWETQGRDFWLGLTGHPILDFDSPREKEIIRQAEARHRTVYTLDITYLDRIAREKCLHLQ
jgi:hypothetical protein